MASRTKHSRRKSEHLTISNKSTTTFPAIEIVMSSMEKGRVSSQDMESESSEEQPQQVQRQGKKRSNVARRQSRQQQQQQPGSLEQVPVPGDVSNNVDNNLRDDTNTLGNMSNSAVQQQGGDDGGKNDALRLRLDLNLDIEIQLKARIHGDLELALL
jgi:hypothetical protein